MRSRVQKKYPKPLDSEGLHRLALLYVGRYATTTAKLKFYLERKIRERGWADDTVPELGDLIDKLQRLGYVDDEGYAASKISALQRRGFGPRRIQQALKAAGLSIDAEIDDDAAYSAALRFAQRRKIGPFSNQATDKADRKTRQRAFAAMIRAGHRPDFARRILEIEAGEIPECDGK